MKNLKGVILLFASILIFSCASKEKMADFEKDVKQNYKLEKIVYQIKDNKSRNLLESQVKKSKFKKGQSLDKETFTKERARITNLIRKNIDPNFSKKNIRFEIDTTLAENKFSILAIVESGENKKDF